MLHIQYIPGISLDTGAVLHGPATKAHLPSFRVAAGVPAIPVYSLPSGPLYTNFYAAQKVGERMSFSQENFPTISVPGHFDFADPQQYIRV